MAACSELQTTDSNDESIADQKIENQDEIQEDVEDIDESLSPLTLINGLWRADVDARAKKWEEEQDVTLTDQDMKNMAKMFKDISINLNEDGTYVLKDPFTDNAGS